MVSLLRRLRAASRFNKASKKFALGSYIEAAEILDGYDGPDFYLAKAILFQAISYHRARELPQAIRKYNLFLSRYLEMISHQGDKSYLQEYAKYFQSRAFRKLDPSVDLHGKEDTLVRLSKLATFATRGEFVPQRYPRGVFCLNRSVCKAATQMHIKGDGEAHYCAHNTVSRLTQTTDPEGYVKSITYDSRDNIGTVTDGRVG